MATSKKTSTDKTAPKNKEPKIITKADMLKKINKIREEAETLKRNMHMGDVQNVHAYSAKKRELARMLTALNNTKQEGKDK
jgi:ribosomal protein L29